MSSALPDALAPAAETTLEIQRSLGLAGVREDVARSAVSDAAVYTLGVYSAQILVFAAGLVQKGLLGPRGTGFWALMGTVGTIFGLASLGTIHGAMRQIPRHRGREDFSAAASAASTASTLHIGGTAVLGSLLAIFALAFGGGWQPEFRYGLVLVGLIAPLHAFADSHKVIFESTKRFSAVSRTLILRAAVTLTVQTLFVYFFGFYGMFMGTATAVAVAILYWRRAGLTGRHSPAFRWSVSRDQIWPLVRIGLPIMIYAQIWLLFVSVDSLIVARFIDVENLGYYALGVSVTSYVLFLPNTIGATLFPRMQERFAPGEDVAAVRHYVTDVQRLLSYALIPSFLGAAFFFVPVLIRQALPAFEPATTVVQIMVAGSFCIGLVQMPLEFLITIGYRWRVTGLMLACLALNAGANYLAVSILDRGVKGAAVATVGSYLIFFAATTVYSLGKAMPAREAAAHLAAVLGAVAYTIAAAWGIEELVGHGGTAAADVARGAAKFALFLLALAPLFVAAERRYRALSLIAGVFARLLRRGRSAGAP